MLLTSLGCILDFIPCIALIGGLIHIVVVILYCRYGGRRTGSALLACVLSAIEVVRCCVTVLVIGCLLVFGLAMYD